MRYESRNRFVLDRLKPTLPDAPALAELCLGHLVENPEELGAFMSQSGYDGAALRAAIGSAHLQRGLIDYFASNEPLLLALCANNALSPETFMRVWAKLNPAG
jgi:hypothetical protein